MKQRTSFPSSSSDETPDCTTSYATAPDLAPVANPDDTVPLFHHRFKIGDRVDVAFKGKPLIRGTIVTYTPRQYYVRFDNGMQRSLGEVNLRSVPAASLQCVSDMKKKICNSSLDFILEEMVDELKQLGIDPKDPNTIAIVSDELVARLQSGVNRSDK